MGRVDRGRTFWEGLPGSLERHVHQFALGARSFPTFIWTPIGKAVLGESFLSVLRIPQGVRWDCHSRVVTRDSFL